MSIPRRSLARLEAESTQARVVPDRPAGEPSVPGLTIAWHPDVGRVGERVALFELAAGTTGVPRKKAVVELSRLTPRFAAADVEPYPLADRGLSRRPIRLAAGSEPGSVRLDTTGSGLDLEVDGEAPKEVTVQIDSERLRRGVTLLLSGRIVLILHSMRELVSPATPDFGLVGQSCALRRVRAEIQRVAGLHIPVLVRGATGTGKELVAEAIHRHGARSGGPYLTVNLAAIPPSLAAAELFGAAKGAFTGADAATPGYFRRAAGGTLFLDEIGEISADLQALLLRTLETGEIQPVGGGQPVPGGARIVAATDADLETATKTGGFRAPLLHRLASYTIHLPSLRDRREDVGPLLVHFLRRELELVDRGTRLDPPLADDDSGPWLTAPLVARLAAFDWPGNVRELRNIARYLVVAWSDHRAVPVEAIDDFLAAEAGPQSPLQRVSAADQIAAKSYKPPSKIADEELLAALRANRFGTRATARALGISRTSLYLLIERSKTIQKAADLGADAIHQALKKHVGNLSAAALSFEVSARGLKLRCAELGIELSDLEAPAPE